jgi:RNA polymerase sigma-70 factor (ECF subfamily)
MDERHGRDVVDDPDRWRFEHLVRTSTGQVLASLIGDLRDFDLAEEALAEALLLAAEHWSIDGFPDEPAAWLLTVARRKAIDRIRREQTRADRQRTAQRRLDLRAVGDLEEAEARWASGVDDDRLRLVFTCCHPALALDAQVALTLRTVCGLTTSEIARGFLVPEATMAQRLVRAKRKIRLAGIPYRVPSGHELPDRLRGVLRVVYLVFNEGYLAAAGDEPVRRDLAEEALRLGDQLASLMPDEPEVLGLLALMVLLHARRDARFDGAGDLVTAEQQDRTRYHRDEIARGVALVEAALARRSPGPYQLEAAIAALHCTAPSFEATDWPQIAALYDQLAVRRPVPAVELNRAVAVGFATGFDRGLELVDALVARDELARHHLLWATRGELLVRLGREADAAVAFAAALDLATNLAERRHLERRLAAVGGQPPAGSTRISTTRSSASNE